MIAKKDTITMYNLPTEVRYCKKCTISNQRPRITFDEEGVCSAAGSLNTKTARIDWILREKELKDLCDRFRRNEGYSTSSFLSAGARTAVPWPTS